MAPLGPDQARWAVPDGILWANDCATALHLNAQPEHAIDPRGHPIDPRNRGHRRLQERNSSAQSAHTAQARTRAAKCAEPLEPAQRDTPPEPSIGAPANAPKPASVPFESGDEWFRYETLTSHSSTVATIARWTKCSLHPVSHPRRRCSGRCRRDRGGNLQARHLTGTGPTPPPPS